MPVLGWAEMAGMFFCTDLTGIWKSLESTTLYCLVELPKGQGYSLDSDSIHKLKNLQSTCTLDSVKQVISFMESLSDFDLSSVFTDYFDLADHRLYFFAFSPQSKIFFDVYGIYWNAEQEELHFDLLFPSTKWKLDLFLRNHSQENTLSVRRINRERTNQILWNRV